MLLTRKYIKNKKGQALVEFALILPILLILVFGVIEFGRVFNAYLIVTNASREGARAASVHVSDEIIETKINNLTSTLGTVEITITKDTTVGSVEVTVKHALNLITPIIGELISESNSIDIVSSSKMRSE